jgi:adenylate cyclase class 2
MHQHTPEEIEVKFIIDDLQAIRQRLFTLGASLKTPRTYENNLLFDTTDHRLRSQDCLLRLRHDQRSLLTYKEPPPTADAEFKVRHEYEVEVSSGTQMHTILARLGFTPVWRYEKYRETFTYQATEIVLDETPCGTFLEIEGSRDAIRLLTTALGLNFTDRITASYSEIFAAVCSTYHIQNTDMTFDNFRTLSIDPRVCRLV